MKPGWLAGTRWITLCSNHLIDLVVARLLTWVGLRRVSIGPPIMVMVRGLFGSLLAAISEIAASTGTVDWLIPIICVLGPI